MARYRWMTIGIAGSMLATTAFAAQWDSSERPASVSVAAGEVVAITTPTPASTVASSGPGMSSTPVEQPQGTSPIVEGASPGTATAPPTTTTTPSTTPRAGATILSSAVSPAHEPRAAEPVPMPAADFEARAATAFGDRFAGAHFPLDPDGQGFLAPVVYVKEGAPLPATFEGSVVTPVRFSLAELQVARARVEPGPLGSGVVVTLVGILPPLTEQKRATFASVFGGAPFRLIESESAGV